jgi:hypothetical protein
VANRRALGGKLVENRALTAATRDERLRAGLSRFREAVELKTFLAMKPHNLGQSKQAVEMLLIALAQTSADTHLQQYRRAMLLYAQDVEPLGPNAS